MVSERVVRMGGVLLVLVVFPTLGVESWRANRKASSSPRQ